MKPSKYLVQLMQRKSFPDFLIAMKYHIDPKEWTECMGMYNQVRKIMKTDRFKDVNLFYDIGCGKRPTLGTIIALSYNMIVECVDPQLDNTYSECINSLYLYQNKLEEYVYTMGKGNKAIVCCNHAHVGKNVIKKFLSNFDDWVFLTTPCCVDNCLKSGRYYIDENVWSPKNKIFITMKGEE